jgi:hypothetical protein
LILSAPLPSTPFFTRYNKTLLGDEPITAEAIQGLETELGRLDSEKRVDAVICGMELISWGRINSWGISQAD